MEKISQWASSPCSVSEELEPHRAAASRPPRNSPRFPPPQTPALKAAETPEQQTGDAKR